MAPEALIIVVCSDQSGGGGRSAPTDPRFSPHSLLLLKNCTLMFCFCFSTSQTVVSLETRHTFVALLLTHDLAPVFTTCFLDIDEWTSALLWMTKENLLYLLHGNIKRSCFDFEAAFLSLLKKRNECTIFIHKFVLLNISFVLPRPAAPVPSFRHSGLSFQPRPNGPAM